MGIRDLWLRSLGTSNISTATSAFSRSGQPENWARRRHKPGFFGKPSADADWDTVDRHGGLDAVMHMIDQAAEEYTDWDNLPAHLGVQSQPSAVRSYVVHNPPTTGYHLLSKVPTSVVLAQADSDRRAAPAIR